MQKKLTVNEFRNLVIENDVFSNLCQSFLSILIEDNYLLEKEEKILRSFLFEKKQVKEIMVEFGHSTTTPVENPIKRFMTRIKYFSHIDNMDKIFVSRSSFNKLKTEYAVFKRAHLAYVKLLSRLDNPNMKALTIMIDECNFSNRLMKSLGCLEIEAVCDLFDYDKKTFERMRNCGKVQIKELEEFLLIHGLTLE